MLTYFTEWALEHIEELQALIQPLLQSPLVREGPAFDAEVSLAKSLPGKLGQHALSVATSLQIVELSRTGIIAKILRTLLILIQAQFCLICLQLEGIIGKPLKDIAQYS